MYENVFLSGENEMSYGLRQPPIIIKEKVFYDIKKVMKNYNLNEKDYYIRIGIENVNNETRKIATIFPAKEISTKSNYIANKEDRTCITIIIDPKHIKYFDGTIIDDKTGFVGIVEESITRYLKKEETIINFIHLNNLEGLHEFKGDMINGREFVGYCYQHELAYDTRKSSKCPECISENKKEIIPEQTEEDLNKLRELGDFLKNR